MTISVTQETDTPQAPVAVEAPPPPEEMAEQAQQVAEQLAMIPAEKLVGPEVAEEKPKGSEAEEEIAALKVEMAELKSALEAKASQEETQALEATVDSLRGLFSENGANGQQEKGESEAKARQAVDDLKERVTTYGTSLENLERTLRASRAQEQVEPNAVPPEVLQQVHQEILTEIFQEMTRVMGTGASRVTRDIMESVRKSSTGMGFFSLVDDKRIVVTGIPEAIRRRLLSPSQVHLAFNEFRRQLSALVPQYRARRFEDLVGARTNANSVATIRRLVDQTAEFGEKLNDIVKRLDTLEDFAGRFDTLIANVKDTVASMNERLDSLELGTQ